MTASLFDPDAIERLARILKEQGLTELEIHHDKARLRLVRGAPTLPPPTLPTQMLADPAAAPLIVGNAPAAPQGATPGATPEPQGEAPPPAGAVKSPMVGIAYLAPEPGAPPYVSVGQTVAAGQTLMLIEAMKTFNQIKAPRAGTVTQILVQPGAPVEYDQPLLVIA
jgi:acetyl-CoA carboxylase biotin carboxyl carrier protein